MYEKKDKVLEYLVDAAKKQPLIKRVVLFGSRVRGDHHDRSDYDVAVESENMSHSDWAAWASGVREKVPTLCGLDLIWVNQCLSKGLLEKIVLEGKAIYEQKKYTQ